MTEYYKTEYGFLGQLYYQLGFNNLYGSWWYMILIASIGISLVICSLDRVIPLYKALKKQGVKRHPSFLKRQRVHGTGTPHEGDLERVQINLKKRNYNVKVENGNILAEKGRFSRQSICESYWSHYLFIRCNAPFFTEYVRRRSPLVT